MSRGGLNGVVDRIRSRSDLLVGGRNDVVGRAEVPPAQEAVEPLRSAGGAGQQRGLVGSESVAECLKPALFNSVTIDRGEVGGDEVAEGGKDMMVQVLEAVRDVGLMPVGVVETW